MLSYNRSMKKYISEGLGVFLLTLIVVCTASYVQDPLFVSIVVAFGLAFVVMVFQHISGGHVNPAITLGNIITKKIKPIEGLFYIIAQFAGAACATIIIAQLDLISTAPNISTWAGFFAEMVGGIIFGLGVAAASFHKVESSKVSTVVGFSVFFGSFIPMILFKKIVILNPAVAFGTSVVSLSVMAGPFVGISIGYILYWLVSESKVLDMLTWKKTSSSAGACDVTVDTGSHK
mgnify:CR=1 FL=1